jgi:hypothetical protein
MPSLLNPVITDAGLAAAVAANGAGLQIQITHIALGTGQYAPANNRTALAARKEKAAVGAGSVGPDGSFKIVVLFPAWAGVPNPYNATEIGFYAGDPDAGGVLFAVHSHPSDVIVQRNAIDYVASFGLQLARVPSGSVTVVVDPGAAQALGLVFAHEAKPDPHAQYAKKAGDTFTGPVYAPTPTAGDSSTRVATSKYVQELGTGKIDFFPSTGAPAGYIKANGALVSRASYANLWVFAQASGNVAASDGAWSSGQFSPGDGATTFRIPDVRGQHLRGFDDGRGVDAGRAIGSYQPDQLLVHNCSRPRGDRSDACPCVDRSNPRSLDGGVFFARRRGRYRWRGFEQCCRV